MCPHVVSVSVVVRASAAEATRFALLTLRSIGGELLVDN